MPELNRYESINILYALQLGVEAWKFGVKDSTLQNCFTKSQVQIEGLFPNPDMDSLQPVEDKIYDCIRVAHPQLQISQYTILEHFINPAEESVEDPIEDIEEQILNLYAPSLVEEDSIVNTPTLPPVTISEALKALEKLSLFSYQADMTPHISNLQELLHCEKRRIEMISVRQKFQQVQRSITDFLAKFLPCIYNLLI